ncbi:hypothetical protein MUY14_21125 [Amycolatopsis sp. FBCC-B4732]|uniref:hypothetical protein n=1 Tax=Amycolatopsis sp. FBCC-B4732 TaxID=3079339 RepID=UPI001FF42635|nr:hypothetical protein [Amycolatopsis sp. FBCC-B4732]UOX92997.1 hypothetical protein MUY14_21125 [Amycolatopsis sp. FBCC-B4732]
MHAPAAFSDRRGTAGFVLGLGGLIFAFIPIIGGVAWPMVILGLIFGIVGTLRANKSQASSKGPAITAVDFKLGARDNTCKIIVDGKVVVEQHNSVSAVCTCQP